MKSKLLKYTHSQSILDLLQLHLISPNLLSVNMVNFYQLVTSVQQINVKHEMRNFKIKIENIKMILDVCKNNEILTPIQSVIELSNEALNILVDNLLGTWKRDQIMFLYGEDNSLERSEKMKRDFDKLNKNLDVIQPLFDELFEHLWHTFTILSVTHYRHSPAFRNITLTIQKLILSSFVIVEQPTQVIHTGPTGVK